ncbi:MAG TPA: glycosyl hydrolase-related protein, partial [Acidimicrobiales bacterium]|nr:glycosyl hydrolase-related protein [Acidimicrobiales bacterium]
DPPSGGGLPATGRDDASGSQDEQPAARSSLAAGARDPSPGGGRSVPAIAVESVKAAEDRSDDVIVRCYEVLGGRARARLRAGFPLARAQIVDLLERPLREVALDAAGRVPIELRPFQVLTLRLSPRSDGSVPGRAR